MRGRDTDFTPSSTARARRRAGPHPALSIALIAPALLGAPAVLATATSTSLSSTVAVTSACVVSGNTLNFGTAISPIAGAPVDNTTTLTVQCTATTGYTVSLNAGANTGGGSNFAGRVLKSGGNSVAYQLYLNNTRTTIWGDGTNTSSTVAGTGTGGTDTWTIYGRLPSLTGAVPGTYTDTVTVTVTY